MSIVFVCTVRGITILFHVGLVLIIEFYAFTASTLSSRTDTLSEESSVSAVSFNVGSLS